MCGTRFQKLFSRGLHVLIGQLPFAFSLLVISGLSVPALSQPVFVRVFGGDIVTDGGISGGVAWGDYDGDGHVDLFVANWYNQSNFLYHNNGDATFARILTGVIVNDPASYFPYSSGPCWGDYDNNGFPDMFVANQQDRDNFLYSNSGGGSFTKITEQSIVTDAGASFSSAWGDYDNDGYLDLYVANAFNQNNYLYRNLGDGTFERITEGDVVNDGGESLGASWGDYNNDGFLDLFVANRSGQRNFLYKNNCDGSFSKITEGSIATDYASSHGGSWADYDNDGDLDLLVANGPYDGPGETDQLFRNDGNDVFTEMSSSVVAGNNGRSGSATWADFDNDGDLDLFVTHYYQTCLLYMNDGDGTFTQITEGVIVTTFNGYSSGNAAADYDNDGDLDVFIANWENQSNFLYRNETEGGGWIAIRCEGTLSNAMGVGAKVRIAATIDGTPGSQMREIHSNHGHRSQSNQEARFGLGDAAIVDTIIIEWPSGILDVYIDVAPNQIMIASEGQGSLCTGFDTDRDGFHDEPGVCPGDNCPDIYNPDQEDIDGDGVGNLCDNCLDDYNPGQVDSDGDNIGDACDINGCCGVVGDFNHDGRVDVSDVVAWVGWSFDGDPVGPECEFPEGFYPECDMNSSGQVDVADVVYWINWSFNGGTDPEPCR